MTARRDNAAAEASQGPFGKRRAVIVVLAALMSSGCMLRDLHEQVQMMDQGCVIEGQVARSTAEGQTLVVALTPGDPKEGLIPEPIDFMLPNESGYYRFALLPGKYRLLAFQDLDGDLELDDDEPARHANNEAVIDCAAGDRLDEYDVALERSDRLPDGGGLALQRGRNLVEDAMASAVSLGQLTSFGDVVGLDDPRFDPERARDSLWRPLDFLRAGNAGVYLAEPFDDERTPVLFVHGINGSPRVLEPLIEHIDGEHFQAMYFYYPSGFRIGQIAWHLDRIMRELEHRHGIERYHVVAHSMGGLVARAWLLERSNQGARARIGSFVSLSTPWSGYPSARQGVDHSPVVVPVWRDMATGSDFLEGLFDENATTSDQPPLHLLFSFRQSGWVSGASSDGVAALASMLPPLVQRQAASVFGIDAGHVEILSNEVAQTRVRKLLLQSQ